MSAAIHSLAAALAVVGTVAAIVFGITSCSEQETVLRAECIKAGGTVIAMGPNHNCIRK